MVRVIAIVICPGKDPGTVFALLDKQLSLAVLEIVDSNNFIITIS